MIASTARDLIAVAAFPKSGVTYLSSMLFYSLFPGTEPALIEKQCIVDVHAHPLAGAREAFGKRFIKTHFLFGTKPDLDAGTEKAIYLVRDPIDVANSAYDFLRLVSPNASVKYGDFIDHWIETGGAHFEFAGTWKEHVASWMYQRTVPVLTVTYTDLVDRPSEQLNRIFVFLDISPAPKDVERALKYSSMEAMRSREEDEFSNRREGIFYSKSVEEGMSKGARFINKGYRNSYDALDADQKARVQRAIR